MNFNQNEKCCYSLGVSMDSRIFLSWHVKQFADIFFVVVAVETLKLNKQRKEMVNTVQGTIYDKNSLCYFNASFSTII